MKSMFYILYYTTHTHMCACMHACKCARTPRSNNSNNFTAHLWVGSLWRLRVPAQYSLAQQLASLAQIPDSIFQHSVQDSGAPQQTSGGIKCASHTSWFWGNDSEEARIPDPGMVMFIVSSVSWFSHPWNEGDKRITWSGRVSIASIKIDINI